MKKGIHPETRDVAFQDASTGTVFIASSTMTSKENVTIDGVEYPKVGLDISSASHPFYTGKSMMIDTQGRIEKFTKKYQSQTPTKKKKKTT